MLTKRFLPIEFSDHAKESMGKRGANTDEVRMAVTEAEWTEVKQGRLEAILDFLYNSNWNKKHYAIKQINPVFAVEQDRIMVIMVYVFYFN